MPRKSKAATSGAGDHAADQAPTEPVVETTDDTAVEASSPAPTEPAPSDAFVDPDPDTDDADSEMAADIEELFKSAVDDADLESKASDPPTDQAAKPEPEPTAEPPSAEPADGTVELDTKSEEPPTQEPEAVQPTPEPVEPFDAQKVLADYQKWTDDAVELLKTQHYNLSDEQAEALETEPAKVYSELAARLHMEVLNQSVAMMMRLVPQIMQEVHTTQKVQATRETEFYEEWPELKQYHDDVVRHGQVYLQTSPGAPFKDFVRDVGAMVAVAQRVDLSKRQASKGPGNGQDVAPPPASPIAAKGGSSSSAPVVNRTEFEILDEEIESAEQNY